MSPSWDLESVVPWRTETVKISLSILQNLFLGPKGLSFQTAAQPPRQDYSFALERSMPLITSTAFSRFPSAGVDFTAWLWPLIRYEVITPDVCLTSLLTLLRRTRRTFPWVLARFRTSDCSGETSRVTVLTDFGSFWAFFCQTWPAVTTLTSCKMIFDNCSPLDSRTGRLIKISTRSPGLMKPATPETSSTFTVKARMDSFNNPPRPAAVPSGASLLSSTGSPLLSGTCRTRPLAWSTDRTACGGTICCGQATALTKRGLRAVPEGMSASANNTCAGGCAAI